MKDIKGLITKPGDTGDIIEPTDPGPWLEGTGVITNEGTTIIEGTSVF